MKSDLELILLADHMLMDLYETPEERYQWFMTEQFIFGDEKPVDVLRENSGDFYHVISTMNESF